MKIWKLVMITGSVIFILGIIFHFQGKSIVGPESSFMYANPEWVYYGTQIVVAGIIISGIGISLKFIRKI